MIDINFIHSSKLGDTVNIYKTEADAKISIKLTLIEYNRLLKMSIVKKSLLLSIVD
jgi:hypothetical protein